VQAANIGTLSDNDRKSIVVELESRLAQLQDIGNRRDSGGEYLFGGFATLTQPFSGADSGTVSYAGDQGSRMLQVGPTQRIADSHSGFDVFMNIRAGNGTFITDVSPLNAGTGQIDVGAVVNRLDWQADDYTLTFTSPTEWEITDSNAQPVANGTYTSGEPISFMGIQVTITGEPATGDTFTINQSRSESMFDTVSRLINELSQPMDSDAAQAKLASAIARTLQQLDQAGDHVLSIRAEVGARLNALDAADAVRENLDIDLASSLSDLRDLDYAQAIAKMNQYMLGLQAAQLSYTRVAQLSLVDYLR
jgi:flagellar hook-associated protein 3 FlgL